MDFVKEVEVRINNDSINQHCERRICETLADQFSSRNHSEQKHSFSFSARFSGSKALYVKEVRIDHFEAHIGSVSVEAFA